MIRFLSHTKVFMVLAFLLSLNQSYGAFLNVISPIENQVYNSGGSLNITYAFFEVDTVKIEVYSPVNGGTWEIVADSFPTSNGTTIPITNLSAPDWNFYQIRVSDFNGIADTAYSGYFTILNPALPTLKLNIKEQTIPVGNFISLQWIASPSVDSIIIQIYKSNRENWENINNNYSTNDSSLKYFIPTNAAGGTYYFRYYDANNTNKFSNIDSVFINDNLFAGIDSLRPNNGDTAVNIMLDYGNKKNRLYAYFKEAINLIDGKIIDIYNETGGLVWSFPTDSPQVHIIPDINGDSSILVIEPNLPLQHSSHYYIIMDIGAISDKSGNIFNGFQSPTDWAFNTVKLHTFSGSIQYDGEVENSMIIGLYTNEDVRNNILTNPANILSEYQPLFPTIYSIGVPENGEYALLCFIDVNDNFIYDKGEPVAFRENLIMNGKDSSGVNLLIKDPVEQKSTFVLDTKKSYWGNKKPFIYNRFINAYYAGNLTSGRTPLTNDAVKKDNLLWGVQFWIHETDSTDLANSVLNKGTALHLEYTYPDSLTVNAIAAGAKIKGLKIFPKRLVIDMEVIDPVESLNSNLKAACGFIISCSPEYTNNINAYGSIFFGDFDIQNLSFAKTATNDLVGLNIVGKNTVEGTLTALLSDSFLVNLSEQFNPASMPANSAKLRGLIPEILPSKYSIDNTADVITSGFDTDGDGKNNKMYAVTITNANWSSRRLLFGVDEASSLNADLSFEKLSIYYNSLSHSIESSDELQQVSIFDITGKHVKTHNQPSKLFELESNMRKGIYFIRFDFGGKTKAIKLFIH